MRGALEINRDTELNQPKITSNGILIHNCECAVLVNCDNQKNGVTLENFLIIQTGKWRLRLIEWILNFRPDFTIKLRRWTNKEVS